MRIESELKANILNLQSVYKYGSDCEVPERGCPVTLWG